MRTIMVMAIVNIKLTKQLAYKAVGILLVATVLLGTATYIFLVQKEKAQFAQAEKEIDALYAQIVDKVGKPDQEKKEKTCGYASRVYGKGPRYCNINSYLLYSRSNVTNSNRIMKTVSDVAGLSPTDHLARKDIVSFSQYEGVGLDQRFSDDLITSSNKTCSINFSYPVLPSLTAPLKPGDKENLLISIHCGGPARAEHFPVKD